MSNLLLLTPALHLDQPPAAYVCSSLECAPEPGTLRKMGLGIARHVHRGAWLLRYAPTLSDNTLDRTGVAELLRRR